MVNANENDELVCVKCDNGERHYQEKAGRMNQEVDFRGSVMHSGMSSLWQRLFVY